ncbi:MAG: winged helix-turn-helix domain-containing protein [Methanobacteriota archaeon]
MSNLVDEFSRNAGNVWDVLQKYRTLSQITLVEATKLDEHQLNTAIGWLARENKICKNGNDYELKETNLTEKIGGDAGRVWRVLETWGDLDITSLVRVTQINENDLFSALGWLARENKIDTKIGQSREGQVRYQLK